MGVLCVEGLGSPGPFLLQKNETEEGRMIEISKITQGVEEVGRESFFFLSSNTRTQGDPVALLKVQCQ